MEAKTKAIHDHFSAMSFKDLDILQTFQKTKFDFSA